MGRIVKGWFINNVFSAAKKCVLCVDNVLREEEAPISLFIS